MTNFTSAVHWLEWMNAFIFFISLGINFTFGLILWHYRDRWFEPMFKAALGIEVYHCGETARQAWYWLWSHFGDRGLHWLQGGRIAMLYLFGSLVAVGALCMIRVFSEHRYGHWLWMPALAIALVGATLMVMLPR